MLPPHNKKAFSRYLLQALQGGLQKGTTPPCYKDLEHRQIMELKAELRARSQCQNFGSMHYSSKTGDSHGQGQAFCFSNVPNMQCSGLFFEGKIKKSHPPAALPIIPFLSFFLFFLFFQSAQLYPNPVRLKKTQVLCIVLTLRHKT